MLYHLSAQRLRITGTRARPKAERSVSGACAGWAAFWCAIYLPCFLPYTLSAICFGQASLAMPSRNCFEPNHSSNIPLFQAKMAVSPPERPGHLRLLLANLSTTELSNHWYDRYSQPFAGLTNPRIVIVLSLISSGRLDIVSWLSLFEEHPKCKQT